MPRYVGKRSHSVWVDVAALIALALALILVLEVTGTTSIFT